MIETVDFGDLYTLGLHIPVAETVFVHRAKRLKQLFDHRYYVLLRVPLNLNHVFLQVAQFSSFLQDVKEQIVINDLRRFSDAWMINTAQRVHFAPLDVLFRSFTPVQHRLVNFLCIIKPSGRPVPNIQNLKHPASLIGGLDAPDYLIDLIELHRVPRDDRSFVIRFDAR